ncbi:MAG: FAD-binding oxidoreductase [Actinobacteria bacterium]|nr:FAD-binding oxidoreductase [Actinomycetota bacterium]
MSTALAQGEIGELAQIVGSEWVLDQREQLLPYAVSLDPAGDCFPATVLRPGSREEVQRIVEVANRRGLSLHPISRGMQHGLGMATAVAPDTVTIELSRMDRILEYDDELGYVVLEPGVTFAQLHRFLEEHGGRYWCSPISGPVEASVLGNALDKGAGYTPVGNHFGNLIGLEVVIGDGRVLTTGDGALPGAKTTYTHKGGCGPMLDALFAQSNYGIVTKAGVWLMPAPPGARGFVFSVPDYDDLGRAVDVAGRLKLTGGIPSTISIANDVFCLAVEAAEPRPMAEPGAAPIDEGELPALREAHGIGAWNVVGCIYGPSETLEARVEKLEQAFAATGPLAYLPEEEARERKAFGYRFDIAKGVPNETELDVYNLHPNGTSLYFLPSVPFRGAEALEAMRLSRLICTEHGFAYTNQFLCSPRSMRNTQPVIFDGGADGAAQRARDCFSELTSRFADSGYLVSRPPTHFQQEVMDGLGLHAELARSVKRAFDPNGVLDPGRFGLSLEDR